MARIEVYPFKVYDSMSRNGITEGRLSTREYIRERGGEIIEGGRRNVDASLVDHQGRLVLDPSSESATFLRELDSADDHGEVCACTR